MNNFVLIVMLVVVHFHGITSHYGYCPSGFTSYKTYCFWLSNIKGSFAEAGHVCQYMKGRLATIKSGDVNTFLKSQVIHNGTGSFYYMGASDLRVEGEWRWEGEERPMIYQDWHPGQPRNWGGKEHCMGFDKAMANQWNDCPCEDRHHFICEI